MKKLITILTSAVIAPSFGLAAEIANYDSPVIAENQALNSAQYASLLGNTASWNTSQINFSSIFGADFNPNLHDIKVTLLQTSFAAPNTGYGISGDMNIITAGEATFPGTESYISYGDGESASVIVSSGFINQSFDVFNDANGAFTWTTVDAEAWYYDYINDKIVKINGDVPTLLVGFEDSLGSYDLDYNDMIFAIQVLPKGQAGMAEGHNPSGQPLPGVLSTALLGSFGFGLYFKRRKK